MRPNKPIVTKPKPVITQRPVQRPVQQKPTAAVRPVQQKSLGAYGFDPRKNNPSSNGPNDDSDESESDEEIDPKLINYYKGWPIQCQYTNDLKWAAEKSVIFLRQIAGFYKPKDPSKPVTKGLVVIDLDDTIFFTDELGIIGVIDGSAGRYFDDKINQEVELFMLPINEPIRFLIEEAKKLGFYVIALTARPAESRLATITNLKMCKIPYDHLIMNTDSKDPYFKINVRKDLSKKGQIVLTIGDMPNDVVFSGGKTAFVKLPSPDMPCSYAYFPPLSLYDKL
jgi:hypothetical protein